MSQIDLFNQEEEQIFGSWEDLEWWKGGNKTIWDKIHNFSMGNYCPPQSQVYRALQLTPFDKVRVVILGQDPYPNPDHAMGLAFSIPAGVEYKRWPPTLLNIMTEYVADLSYRPPQSGDLTAWAERGVLLLNTRLTVQKNRIMSHAGLGWEDFAQEVLEKLIRYRRGLVFILWGKEAQDTFYKAVEPVEKYYWNNKHFSFNSAHPSPRSCHRGFFGSKPFSKANQFLDEPIDWRLE